MHTSRHSNPAAAKQRDRARSILPSTSRREARRRLSAVRRQHRHDVTRSLRTLARTRCTCDELGGEGDTPCVVCDYTEPAYPLSEHRDAIARRRAGDKLGPLLRWARQCRDTEAARLGVDALDVSQATDLVRRLRAELPDGVVGWHAVSHLRFEVLPLPAWWASWRPRRTDPTSALAALAHWALATGRHRALNRVCLSATSRRGFDEATSAALDVAYQPCPPGWVQRPMCQWRPLAGHHDVDAWAGAVTASAAPLLGWAVTQGWCPPANPPAAN